MDSINQKVDKLLENAQNSQNNASTSRKGAQPVEGAVRYIDREEVSDISLRIDIKCRYGSRRRDQCKNRYTDV